MIFERKTLFIAAALAVAIVYYGCEKKDDPAPIPPPTPPVADFTYAIINQATRTVAFTNTSSYAQSYSWHFGDASTSTLVSPQHSYPSYGNYSVSLTAHGEGGTNTVTKTVTLNP